MKKILSTLMLAVFALVLTMPKAHAAETLTELYPYDSLEVSEGTYTGSSFAKVGDSFWDFTFLNHRYHVAANNAVVMSRQDAKGLSYFDASNLQTLGTSAFGVLFINDTANPVKLEVGKRATGGINHRGDFLKDNIEHRIFVHFDKDGNLTMFEDQVYTYNLTNIGTESAPEYRLATAEEVAAMGEENTKTLAHNIRLVIDKNDPKGYKVEPIVYTKWYNKDLYVKDDPTTEKSLFVEGNPANVTIPAGGFVMTFGANDRGATYPKPYAYILSMPELIAAGGYAPAKIEFNKAGVFTVLDGLDKDTVNPGIQHVVPFRSEFELPQPVVTWDQTELVEGIYTNKTDKLSYEVEISQNGEVLDLVKFNYDATSDSYIADKISTVVDTTQFGVSYQAKYSTVTAKGRQTVKNIDIVIGVMPPKFEGVKDQVIPEGLFYDHTNGISADDGYGVDYTDQIKYTLPQNFNVYNPKIGVYTIQAQFDRLVVIPATAAAPEKITVKTGETEFETTSTLFNAYVTSGADKPEDIRYQLIYFTETENLKKLDISGWASGMVLHIGEDGKIIKSVDRRGFTGVNTTTALDQTKFNKWFKEDLVLGEKEYAIVVGHSHAAYNTLKAATVDTVVDGMFTGDKEFRRVITTTTSFNVEVKDTTAPELIVVNDKYTIEAGQYKNVDEAILGNVIAIDNHDARGDILLFVEDAGGLNVNKAGTYTVLVSAKDKAGLTTYQEFVVVVTKAKATVDELEDTKEEINEVIVGDTISQEEVDQLIKDAVNAIPEPEKGISVGTVALVSIASALLSFGGSVLLIFKKK